MVFKRKDIKKFSKFSKEAYEEADRELNRNKSSIDNEQEEESEEEPITIKLDEALKTEFRHLNDRIDKLETEVEKQKRVIDSTLIDLFNSIGHHISKIKEESNLIRETAEEMLGRFSEIKREQGDIRFEDTVKQIFAGILNSISSVDNEATNINSIGLKVNDAFKRLSE